MKNTYNEGEMSSFLAGKNMDLVQQGAQMHNSTFVGQIMHKIRSTTRSYGLGLIN